MSIGLSSAYERKTDLVLLLDLVMLGAAIIWIVWSLVLLRP